MKKIYFILIFTALIAVSCNKDTKNDVVFEFRGGSVTKNDLFAHAKKMKKMRAFKRSRLSCDDIIQHSMDMELIIAKGLDKKLHLDPFIRNEIHSYMSNLFLKYLTKELVPEISRDSISNEEIKEYYLENKENYRKNNSEYDFEKRKEYIRNDVLYSKYRKAWEKAYEDLGREFGVSFNDKNLEKFKKEYNGKLK